MKGGEFRRLWLARLGLETATAGSGELDVKHSIDVGQRRSDDEGPVHRPSSSLRRFYTSRLPPRSRILSGRPLSLSYHRECTLKNGDNFSCNLLNLKYKR